MLTTRSNHEVAPDMQTMADKGTLTILTDVWSKSVARELLRRWPGRKLEVRYLDQQGADWTGSKHQPPVIKATLLDPDMSGIFLSDGTRFTYAVSAYAWETTKLFHRTVLKESTWARLISRFYGSRGVEVLCARNFYGWISRRVFLCLFARYLSETGPGNSKETIVFLSSNPFGDWLVNHLQGIYAPIFVGPEPPYTKIFAIQARAVLRRLFSLGKRIVRQIVRQSPGQPQLSSGQSSAALPTAIGRNARRAVAVEACMGLELEKERSDLFWLPHSGIPDEQVLVYFDRPGTVSDETLAVVQGHGWQPVVLRRDGGTATAALRRLNWRRLPLILFSAPFWLLEKPQLRRTALWCSPSVLQLIVSTATWEAFFAGHGVRLHSNHSDQGMAHHVPQSVALKWQGGINLHTEPSFDYSNPAAVGASGILPFDVLFVWGSLLAHAFQEYDFAGITTLVTAGYPFDYLFEAARERAVSLRHELEAAGAHKVICLFDSSFCKNSVTSGQEIETLYRVFLTEVVDNPRLGLVLKPKNVLHETLLETSELHGLLDTALGTGRCIVLETKSYMHWVSPCEAALASDLAVGYPINSAVIEAVLAGIPGVHIDLTKQRRHLFYEVGYERFIFDDLERAMAAVRRWLRNPADEPGLGDHSDVINQIDPFRDGKAAQRVGQYMTWLLEGFQQGLCRDDVVRRASRQYAEKYGAQHVRLAPRLGHL